MGTAKEMRSKALSNIVSKNTLREVQEETMDIIANALKQSYGPNGSTTVIRMSMDEKDTGRTEYTKDGHKILGSIRFNKPIELSIVDDLRDITRNTVKKVGDGTTSAVLLSNYIFKELLQLHRNSLRSIKNNKSEYKYSEKQIVDTLQNVSKKIFDIIKEYKQEPTLDLIYNIAYTSTDGNTEVATHIRDLYEEFGNEVYIDIKPSNTTESMIKTFEGLTIDQGYFNSNFINNTEDSTCRIKNAKIYIFEDAIDTPEMMGFFGKIITDNIIKPLQNKSYDFVPTVVFSTAYGGDVRSAMDQVLNQLGQFDPSTKPPLLLVTNIHREEFLFDLAKLSGARTIKKYIDPNMQKIDIEQGLAPTPDTVHEFAGEAEEVVADVKSTKIINPKDMFDKDGNKSDVFNNLIKSLKSELSKYEDTKEDLTKINIMKRRIKSLESCMVEYYVGGISHTDRNALIDSIEDAVLNCRSAAEYGVGFGANFNAIKALHKLINEDVSMFTELEYMVIKVLYDAYREVYDLIYINEEIPGTVNLVIDSIEKDSPYNIRTKQFDKLVLSSIQSDIVILDAIVKIVGLMFKSNQYILASPNLNTYEY